MQEHLSPASLQRFRRTLILSSVVMIGTGAIAIAHPSVAGLSVTILIGWLLALSGLAYLVYAFTAWRIRSFLWRALIGSFDVGVGIYIGTHPTIGLASLTLWLTILLCVEGVFEIVLFLLTSRVLTSAWLLLNGIVTLLLGAMIWMSWPNSATWAIGTLIGFNLVVSGLARLALARTLWRYVPTA